MIGNKKKSGFTLIELIVSIALFSVIILITTNIFLLVINSQRSAIATQNVQESMKYFLEVIGKEMRMAQKDPQHTCSAVPANRIFMVSQDADGNDILVFKNYYDQCVTYDIAPDVKDPSIKRFQIVRSGGIVGFISPAQITIDHLYFTLKPSSSSTQAMITINVKAHALNEAKFKSSMTIQTSITSRYYK